MIISHDNLRTLAKDILTAAGSIGNEPQLVSDNLVAVSYTHLTLPTKA